MEGNYLLEGKCSRGGGGGMIYWGEGRGPGERGRGELLTLDSGTIIRSKDYTDFPNRTPWTRLHIQGCTGSTHARTSYLRG